jgi:deoxyhypusine synthase
VASKKVTQKEKLYYQVKKSADLTSLAKIKGTDFELTHSLESFLKSFATIGLQASELSHAIEVVKMMRREHASIYLSFTSNMVSCGVRDIITYLVKHKHVQVLCTAAGGVEEDVIKSFSPMRLGTFDISGKTLFDEGVARIGNIYATNEQYSFLELFMRNVFDALLIEQHKTKKPSTPSDIARKIGELLQKSDEAKYEQSYLYWAYKHNISVYCPGIVDGAIGDHLYFYKKTHPEFILDVTKDHENIIDYTLQQEKTGAIVLGGGIAKHYVLNANIFKEGFDYSVFLSTAQGFDGSDSGGNPQEAISWAKVKVHSPAIKVYCDASISFPLLVAGAFISKN